MSFVPRGLWVIGASGRIDVITRNRTQALLALQSPGHPEWCLLSREGRRRQVPFDNDALLAIVNES